MHFVCLLVDQHDVSVGKSCSSNVLSRYTHVVTLNVQSRGLFSKHVGCLLSKSTQSLNTYQQKNKKIDDNCNEKQAWYSKEPMAKASQMPQSRPCPASSFFSLPATCIFLRWEWTLRLCGSNGILTNVTFSHFQDVAF